MSTPTRTPEFGRSVSVGGSIRNCTPAGNFLSLWFPFAGSGTATRSAFRNFLCQGEGFFSIRDLAIEKPRSDPGQRTTDVGACETEFGQLRTAHRCAPSPVFGPPAQDPAPNRAVGECVERLHGLFGKISERGIHSAASPCACQGAKRSIGITPKLNDSSCLFPSNGESLERPPPQRSGQRCEPDRETGDPRPPSRRRPFRYGNHA